MSTVVLMSSTNSEMALVRTTESSPRVYSALTSSFKRRAFSVTNRPDMSKGELEVARVVWKLGQATVGQVYEAFASKRQIDYATVQTYIRRLETKGYLRARRVGRNKVYSSKVRPRTVIRQAMNDFMDQLFDGQVVPMMRHLIDERGVTPDELEQLRQMLNQAKGSENERND